MRSTVASALLGLALFGCGACAASSASGASAPQAQPAMQPPHQISPVQPPRAMGLRVELRSHGAGAGCDQLLLNGARSDLPDLEARARTDVGLNPAIKAEVFADPSCTPADVKKVIDALHEAGVAEVVTPVPAAPTHGAEVLPGAPPSGAEKAAAQGTNAFAVTLYQQLARGQQGNLFFSPTSVAAALALVQVGAAGQTASQLQAALHAPAQDLAALLQRYQASRGDTTLDIANRLWGAPRFAFKPSYLATVRQDFGAAAEAVDFAHGDAARAAINGWVSQNTQGKIPELIGRNALGPDTQFVLTNAVYFYGAWQSPFDPKQTAEGPFTLASGAAVQAPLMHEVIKTRAAAVGPVQVVELPYGKRGTLAFDLILPTRKDGLAAVEAGLTPAWLEQTLGALRPARVTLALPKFTQRSQFALAKPLAAMGLEDLFSHPDLSAMTEARAVAISAVVHQAFVDVSEKGTEAAAATAVIGTRMVMRVPELTVTADHPFLFVIRDTATGGVLFMGRVADPRP